MIANEMTFLVDSLHQIFTGLCLFPYDEKGCLCPILLQGIQDQGGIRFAGSIIEGRGYLLLLPVAPTEDRTEKMTVGDKDPTKPGGKVDELEQP